MRFWYRLCYWVCRIGLFFWHPSFHVAGKELIPAGKAIFCANHSGMADPLWILLALNYPDMIRIIAKNELSKVPVLNGILRYFRIIFVKRGQHDVQAYDECIRAVRDEEDKLLVFIEGTRCNGDKHVRPHTGAVRMALAADAPVVPVFVTRNKTFWCPIHVRFGEPVRLGDVAIGDHEALQAEADEILRKIYRLGGDSYADQIGKDSGLLLRS